MKLKSIIEDPSTRGGRLFDLSIQSLIVLSLVTFSIETLPGLSTTSYQVLQLIEIVTVAIFTVEYLLRLLVADRRISFAFSFYGIIDLLAILPFYISTGFDLRTLRVVRMLRLFRILKLVRYSRAIQRFHKAFLIAREELILFFAVTLVLFYLSAVGVYYFENQAQPEVFSSVFHSLWWSVITLSSISFSTCP